MRVPKLKDLIQEEYLKQDTCSYCGKSLTKLHATITILDVEYSLCPHQDLLELTLIPLATHLKLN